ncbi:sensor histidine kinase [Parabacteroides chinchillae]|uniref:histidine kinase n=1 Tax=Parabacteroides chinchillae TaxID=871327 RepID=A0A8G2BWR8_9BACT|nr:HAMP domain-containing sensor histidine kinase [Parabacteroides chinchillae]SEF85172.1 Histidine kinase-, DNA gyrase B-, and HSP90-like ATPase [Parabacteroides chinchillae]
MKISYFIIAFIFCFCTNIQAQENLGNEFMKQAQTSFEQKDYTKARYLYIRAYNSFANQGKYAQAVECGTKGAFLYYRENYYKEAFELCRQMTQLLQTEEQKSQNVFYDERFQITKERLQMYMKLKNAAQAELQLAELNNLANQSKSSKLAEDLLYTKASYYYALGKNEQGDAAFQKLISQYREKKEYDKVSDCYRSLINIALNSNDAPLMKRTYEKYIVWTDSVKAFNAQDKLGALQMKYDESLKTIQEKDSQLSGKQYMIVGLTTFVVILIAALLLLIFILLRYLILTKKLKNIIKINNEHNEQQTKFIQSISEQMAPTLDMLGVCVGELPATVSQQAVSIKSRVDALRQFGLNIQELSSLEGSLMEPYEVQSFNVGNFCKKTMDKIVDDVQPEVETVVDAPALEVKTNAVQLERILLHLLRNAAINTSSGKITLEFKRKGAHLCNFIVTDSGTGIPAERRESIFRPFMEAKDLADGDGLGLPICALVANKLNGNLSLDMDYKRGCRFVLSLQI